MKRNWKYFAAAVFVCGAALLKAGAPPFAIGLGILLSYFMTLRATRNA
jgi:hypothetical protein